MNALTDRRSSLVVFGILQILLGLLAAAFVLVVAAGHELAEQRGGAGSGAALASAIVVYGIAAVYFVSVGIGSIRARRWARALSVVVSAMWAAGGVVASLMVAIVLPRVLRALAPGNGAAAGGAALVVVLICGFALPVTLFLYYRREDVRLTCERVDTKPRWTDRVPLPVLAVVLVFAFAAISLLANMANPSFAVMGREVSGAPAAMALFAFAALCAVVSVQLYRLKESAWWILVLLQLAGVGYAVATFTFTDPGAIAPAGTPAEVAAVYRDPIFLGVVAATWIGYFAFLLFLRRYFVTGSVPRTRRADQSTFSE